MQDAPRASHALPAMCSQRLPGRDMFTTSSALRRSCIRVPDCGSRTRSKPCWQGGSRRCAPSRTTAAAFCCAVCASGPETVNMAENLETVRLTREYISAPASWAWIGGRRGDRSAAEFPPIFDLAQGAGPRATRATRRAGHRAGRAGVRREAYRAWPPYFLTIPRLAACDSKRRHAGDLPDEQYPVQNAAVLCAASGEKAAGRRASCVHQHRQYDPRCRNALEDEYRHCVADMGFAPDDLGKPWPASRWDAVFTGAGESGIWLGNFKLKQIFEYFLTHPPPLWYTCRRGGRYHMLSEQELLEMESAARAPCADAAVRPRGTFAPFAAFERLRRGCAGGRTAGAGGSRVR